MQKVNIMVGRFQPFTTGHYKCVQYAYKHNKLPTVICMIGVDESKVDNRHPFTSDMLINLYSELFKNNNLIKDIIQVKSANIVAIGQLLNSLGYEVASWTCGSDRYDSYLNMATKYHDVAMLSDDFEVIEVPRSDEDISATKARNCLLDDDKEGFFSMIPDGANKEHLYDVLKEQIQKVYNESLHRRVAILERLFKQRINWKICPYIK